MFIATLFTAAKEEEENWIAHQQINGERKYGHTQKTVTRKEILPCVIRWTWEDMMLGETGQTEEQIKRNPASRT